MRYRIEVNSPRHGVTGEWFCEFKRSEVGRESVRTDPTTARWMDLPTARIALRRLREPQYRVRCRLLDEHGNCHSDFDDTPDRTEQFDIFNSHEDVVHRRRLDDGQLIEALLTHNKVLRKFYLKISMNPDPAAPGFDQSISGDSPDQVLERFWSNPGIPDFVKQRYLVDDSFLQQSQAEPAAPPAVIPTITVPKGFEVIAVRPGSAR